NTPLPKIVVNYRNVTAVHFRAVAYDWSTFLQKRHSRPEYLNDEERKELLAKKPTLEWSAELPATTDYAERIETLPAPDKLKPGFYFIVASHDPSFDERENQVTYTDIWVSDIALVIRQHAGNIEGFVLEAISGEPVPAAEVMAWHLDNNGNRTAVPATQTDTNGFFRVKPAQQRPPLIRARHNGRELGSQNEFYAYGQGRDYADSQTIFFTDRSIYRPGQTIQYKGICIRVDQALDNYNTLSGQSLTVLLNDTNGKEIARQVHRCNDYGSFSGSFTAPRDRLMGSMHLATTDGPNGSANFNVEEYKRPKFQVSVEPPETGAKLNQKVRVTGKATADPGAPIDAAQVKYRVVRQVRYPYWWSWYYGWWAPQRQTSQEI